MKKGLSYNCLKIPEYKDYICPQPGNFDLSEEKIIMETLVECGKERFVPANRTCNFYENHRSSKEPVETFEEREKRIKLYKARAARLQDLYSGDPLDEEDRPKPKKVRTRKKAKLKKAS